MPVATEKIFRRRRAKHRSVESYRRFPTPSHNSEESISGRNLILGKTCTEIGHNCPKMRVLENRRVLPAIKNEVRLSRIDLEC